MSTGLHLKKDYLIIEKEEQAGGLCTTEERDGFLFDRTGHWLHVVRPDTTKLVKRITSGGMERISRKSNIFSRGRYTLYPYQSNTYGLPLEVVKENIRGFIEARYGARPDTPPSTFNDYILRHFGRGIARNFMVPYNRKLWTLHPRYMSSHWCDTYVPKPGLDEILDGALTEPANDVGYNSFFFYPKGGGIGTMTDGFIRRIENRLMLGKEPASLDLSKKLLTLTSGESIHYRNLVSTIPLPSLVKLLVEAPPELKKAAGYFRWASVIYLNVALKSPVQVDTHWTYFPEKEYPFYRAGSPSNAAPWTAPPGRGSLYVEISSREGFDMERMRVDVLAALSRCGLVRSRKDVLFSYFGNIRYGYVIFDLKYERSLSEVTRYFRRRKVHLGGRYGLWTYNGMRSAIEDGMEIAGRIKGTE